MILPIIYYGFQIGDVNIPLASSRCIKFNKAVRKWVDELDFFYEFENFEELKEIIEASEEIKSEGKKVAEYFKNYLTTCRE